MSVHSLRNLVHNAFATKHLFRAWMGHSRGSDNTLGDYYAPDQGYPTTICQHANQNAPRVLYLSNPPRGAMFSSTNRNQVELCLLHSYRSTNSEETHCIWLAILFSSVGKNGISRRHVEVESFSSSISWYKNCFKFYFVLLLWFY